MPATRPYIPHIPLVTLAFDFDRTPATGSVGAILGDYGVDREEWDRRYRQPLGRGWDDITRRGQALIDLGRDLGRRLSRAVVREAAAAVRLYNGAMEMPERLREVAREIHDAVRLEFVVLSSGCADIVEASGIGRAFDRILASTFHYDAAERADCVKRVVSHPEKALYLAALDKGLNIDGANAPDRAGRAIGEHDRHAQFDQMIYLGDGASDLQAFGFLTDAGGLAIAIDDDRELDSADQQTKPQRVDDPAPSDYGPTGELMAALTHAVSAATNRVALRALRRGE